VEVPEHVVAPGVQPTQAPARQTGVGPEHGACWLQLPVSSQVRGALPTQSLLPGVQEPASGAASASTSPGASGCAVASVGASSPVVASSAASSVTSGATASLAVTSCAASVPAVGGARASLPSPPLHPMSAAAPTAATRPANPLSLV